MIIILLIIIACCLLFGADKTKEGMSGCLTSALIFIAIAALLGSCSS